MRKVHPKKEDRRFQNVMAVSWEICNKTLPTGESEGLGVRLGFKGWSAN